jgi:hypothetical protein
MPSMFPRAVDGRVIAHACLMRPIRALLPAMLIGILAFSVPASAVTVDQIVALSKAGISEAVILALLDRDGNVLTIEPAQVIALKRDGLSDTLIMAMLKNGRAEGEDAARADAALKASSILTSLAISTTPTPEVVIVGHGPDLPNTAYITSGGYSNRRGGVIPHVPYAPWSVPLKRGYSNRQFDGRGAYGYGDRLMCLAEVNTPNGPGPSYVTVCPALMQPTFRAR